MVFITSAAFRVGVVFGAIVVLIWAGIVVNITAFIAFVVTDTIIVTDTTVMWAGAVTDTFATTLSCMDVLSDVISRVASAASRVSDTVVAAALHADVWSDAIVVLTRVAATGSIIAAFSRIIIVSEVTGVVAWTHVF
jgi:hypothetical protein